MDKNLYSPIRLVCTVVFCLFSLIYFYVYQADVMAVAQRVASKGKTHYEPFIGAILITVALQMLQSVVYMLTRLYRSFYVLTYIPSFLAMLFLISIADGHVVRWGWIAPLVLLLWGLLMWYLHGRQMFEGKETSSILLSGTMANNLLQMALMMFAVSWIGGRSEASFQQAHAERVLQDNVRAFTSMRDTITNPQQRDVDQYLIQLLMQKQVRAFVRQLPRYYDVSQPLPRCYAEALVLNMSLTHHPQVYWRGSYDGERLDSTFQYFLQQRQTVRQAQKEKAPSQSYPLYETFCKQYRDTYWYYYFNS